MEMSILAWIVVGLIAGALAKFVLPGDDPGGCIVTTLIGIVGALLGGFLFDALFDVRVEGGVNLASIGVAIVGAIILLLIYRLVAGRRRR